MNAGAILRELGLGTFIEKRAAGLPNFLRRLGGVAKGKGFGAYDSKQLGALVKVRQQFAAVKGITQTQVPLSSLGRTPVPHDTLAIGEPVGNLRAPVVTLSRGRMVPRPAVKPFSPDGEVAPGQDNLADGLDSVLRQIGSGKTGTLGAYASGDRLAAASARGGVPTQRHEIWHGITHNAHNLPAATQRQLPYMTQLTSKLMNSERAWQPGVILDEFGAQLAGPRTLRGKLRTGLDYLGHPETVQAYNSDHNLGRGFAFARNALTVPTRVNRAIDTRATRAAGTGALGVGAAGLVGSHGYYGQQQQAADSESRYLDMRRQQLAESRRLSSQIGQ